MPTNATNQDVKDDPFLSSNFAIEVSGVAIAMFKSASGLEVSVDVIEYKESMKDGKTLLRKIPGQPHYGDVTFTRGMTKDSALYDWHKLVLDGKFTEAVKTASVVVYDHAMVETARWNLERCWPSKISVSGFEAGSSEPVIEEMTFVADAIERVKK